MADDEIQKLVTKNPNARALVVIVTNDIKDKQLKEVPGCHIDGEKMRETFKQSELNFALLPTKKNCPAGEIKSLIKQVAKCKFPSSYKYFVFVYSGHGGDNCLEANDGERVNIQCSIIDPLEPGKTSLDTGNIVKLFFINSCRGNFEMRKGPATLGLTGIERGNYIIAYATMKDYMAYEGENGSKWMVPLAEQLRQCSKSVQEILSDVTGQVRNDPNLYQNPAYDTTCGTVYLYPGISGGLATGVSATVPPTTQPQSLAPTESAATVRGDKKINATGGDESTNVAGGKGSVNVARGNYSRRKTVHHHHHHYGQSSNQLTGGASPVAPPTTTQPQTTDDFAPPSTKKQKLSPHDSNKAPKLDASEALLQLDQVKFPHNQWNDLATGLRLGGEIGKFDEGTDYNKKLQRLITYWCANEKHSWQQLVDAVVKCGQKMIAIQLAENVDATPPE